MTPYAAPADLASWIESASAPDNAVALLRTASYTVREATSTAFYAADPATGLPTDATLIAAFRDATCAQAAALDAAGIDPLAGGISQPSVEESAGIGSARIVFADAQQAVKGKQQLIDGLCLEAARILRQAGIVLGVPWIVG